MGKDGNKRERERLCWACQTQLSAGQIKCLECESWQNWRKYLNLSGTTLPLLIALVTSATLLSEVIFGWMSPQKALSFSASSSLTVETDSNGFNIQINLQVTNHSSVALDVPRFASCGWRYSATVTYREAELEVISNELTIIPARNSAVVNYRATAEFLEHHALQISRRGRIDESEFIFLHCYIARISNDDELVFAGFVILPSKTLGGVVSTTDKIERDFEI